MIRRSIIRSLAFVDRLGHYYISNFIYHTVVEQNQSLCLYRSVCVHWRTIVGKIAKIVPQNIIPHRTVSRSIVVVFFVFGMIQLNWP